MARSLVGSIVTVLENIPIQEDPSQEFGFGLQRPDYLLRIPSELRFDCISFGGWSEKRTVNLVMYIGGTSNPLKRFLSRILFVLNMVECQGLPRWECGFLVWLPWHPGQIEFGCLIHKVLRLYQAHPVSFRKNIAVKI